uniref:peptidylprolyl isomerase n=1 Tax=Craspedostauros australis TaxID=1486917 RepID=A0A7R9WPE4_9STRA|mmetsp:Transcript_12255/g.33707  ORF Transcript_12255/g.33707 Transcript_12255/m.33707 type:complete len:309 (+) Transcript_12255:83-1009(+)
MDEVKKIKGDDLLLKVIKSTKTGDDAKTIQSDDHVLIQIVGRQSNDLNHIDGPIFQDTKSKSWLVKASASDLLVPAIRLCLPHCKVGQTVHIWSTAQHALGDSVRKLGKYQLPPNSSVLYTVTVSQIVMDTSRLNPYFTIQLHKTRKEIANDLYQCQFRSMWQRAILIYDASGKALETLLNGTYFASVESNHPQRNETRQLMLDCFNNVVAVCVTAKQYKRGRDAVQTVLKHDANNKKALLRNANLALMDAKLSGGDRAQAMKMAQDAITYHDAKEFAELEKLQTKLKAALQKAKQDKEEAEAVREAE